MIDKLPRWIWMGASLLAMCAGYVNAVALSGIANGSVSHISGSVTIALEKLASGEGRSGLSSAGIVLAFFAGATLSGIIIKNETLKAGRRYGVALLIESVLLTVATVTFSRNFYAGELLAALACGLQNAMVATYSGSVIRTTHLSGIVSDLGASLGNWLAGRVINWAQVRLHLSILSGFAGGALLGSVAYDQLHYRALLAPAALVAILGLTYIRVILPRGH